MQLSAFNYPTSIFSCYLQVLLCCCLCVLTLCLFMYCCPVYELALICYLVYMYAFEAEGAESENLATARNRTQVLRLKHSVPPVQYMERIVGAGGCPVVRALAAQARGPGFDSWRLPAFHFLLPLPQMHQPSFIFRAFSFCVHNNTRSPKGLVSFIIRMRPGAWMRGGCRGEKPNCKNNAYETQM